jgi:hypothetical protein
VLPHRDQFETVVVHFSGGKRWRIAPCVEQSFPEGPMMLHECPPDQVEAKSFARAEVVDMRPGSALLVPRDWWHSTAPIPGESPGLSLSFGLDIPHRCQYLFAHLTNYFPKERVALLSAATAKSRDRSRREIFALYRELIERTGSIPPALLVPETLHPAPGDRLRRRPEVALAIDAGATLRIGVDRALRLDPEDEPLCRALLLEPGWIRCSDVLARAGAGRERAALRLVIDLVMRGALELTSMPDA